MPRPHPEARYPVRGLVRLPVLWNASRDIRGVFFHTAGRKFARRRVQTLVMGDAILRLDQLV
jgi:hypothetical protein